MSLLDSLYAALRRAPRFRRDAALACLAALAWAAAGAAGGAASAERPPDEGSQSVRPPVTFEKVWLKTGKKRGRGTSRMTGDLTLTEAELTFSSRKRDVTIPLESIHRLSYGKMRGDVDTDWIVLAILEDGQRRLVGLRDGRKLGYGQQTDLIYDTILDLIRRAGVAQYDVPEGFRVYDRLDDQFTMAIPAGWTVYHRTLVDTGQYGVWGEAVFSPEPVISEAEPEPVEREELRQRMLRAIDDGEAGAFFVDRREARRGMLCEGLSEKAMDRLQQWVTDDPLFDQGRGVEESIRTEPIVIDGCKGLRIVRQSRRPDQAQRVLDLRVVSDDEIVFLFGLRSQADRYESDLALFETAVGSVRLSVARDGPR